MEIEKVLNTCSTSLPTIMLTGELRKLKIHYFLIKLDLIFLFVHSIGDLSALTSTVGRFTSEEQLKKFESFLEAEKDGLGSLHTSLSSAVNTAKANFEWDDKYMKEFINHLHEISSASIKVISMIVSVFTLFTLYLFN